MATAQAYIARAIAKSIRNAGQQIAGELELLSHFNGALMGLFAVAARVNPSYFGKIEEVALDTDHWPWPADSNLIYYLQDRTVNPTAEVAVVPYDDRQAEPNYECVYQLGKAYYPAGLPNDPTAELHFWYSRFPELATAGTDEMDPDWPVQMDELMHYEIALRIAAKDARGDDLTTLGTERDRWLSLYVATLEHASAIERRRRPTSRTFTSPSMEALTGMLATK